MQQNSALDGFNIQNVVYWNIYFFSRQCKRHGFPYAAKLLDGGLKIRNEFLIKPCFQQEPKCLNLVSFRCKLRIVGEEDDNRIRLSIMDTHKVE